MIISRTTCFAALILLLWTGPAVAQRADTQQEQRPSREQILQEQIDLHLPGLQAREQKIETELRALDRDALPEDHWARRWAGKYYTGDGLGMNVRIMVAPESGVTYTWHGCLGLYDMNHGDIAEVLPDGLRLQLAFDPALQYYGLWDDRLYFVNWGELRFLVPERKMLQIVNNYNNGGYAKESMFDIPRWYEREVSHGERMDIPATRPTLPAPWDAMLRDDPVRLRVTSLQTGPVRQITERSWRHSYALVFTGGSDAGAYVGMEFEYGDGWPSGTITITEVGETTCRGEMITYADQNQRLPVPTTGETVVMGEEESP